MSGGKIESAEFIRSAHGSEGLLRDRRPQIAFVGRSNVGKSSLMNRLLGRKGLARTSSTPGRTRAVNYFLINDRFYFVDLPGYGWARAGRDERQQWAELVDGYLRQTLPGVRVVLLVDSKIGGSPLDAEALRYLKGLGAGVTVVATKIDRLPRSKRSAALAQVRRTLGLEPEDRVIAASAELGDGIKEIWSEIDRHLDAMHD